MAVRFSATGQEYTSTSSPPTAPFTVVCWVYLSADRNYYSTVWDASPSTGDYLYPATDADGTTLRLFRSGTAALTGLAMTTATWYRVAVTVDATGLVPAVLYHGAATGALTVATGTFGTVPTPTTFRIGQSVFGDEHLNGRVAALKHWNAVLTQAEVEAELGQYQPVRGANLVRWHPFIRAETTDYSGNGLALTGGTGTATEDGPPIPWGPSPVLLGAPAVSAAVEGELAGAALVPTAGVSATVTVAGQVAGAAGLPAGAFADDVSDPGQFAGVASLPTVSGAGVVTAGGAVATAGPLPVAAVSGEVTGGTLTGVAPGAAGAVAGTVTATGVLAGEPQGPAVGASGLITVAGAFTGVAPPAGGGFVSNTATGALAAAAPMPTATGAATATTAGVVAATAPLPVVVAAGSAPGLLAAAAPSPSIAAAAVVTGRGHTDAVAPRPEAALAAHLTATGDLGAVAPRALAALEAVTAPTGALTATAPLPASGITAVVIATGQWHTTTPLPRLVLAGVPALARGTLTPTHRDGPTIQPATRTAPTMTGGAA